MSIYTLLAACELSRRDDTPRKPRGTYTVTYDPSEATITIIGGTVARDLGLSTSGTLHPDRAREDRERASRIHRNRRTLSGAQQIQVDTRRLAW